CPYFSRKIGRCGCDSPIDPLESGHLRREGEGLRGAARGRRELGGVLLTEAPEGRRHGAGVARIHHSPAAAVDDHLRAAGRSARDDRDSRGERLQVDVAERLVPARQDDDVRGGVPALDVRPRTEPCDATVHAEAGGAVPKRLRGALPDDDEAARAVREGGERVDRGGEPLALEATPDEEQGPRVGGHSDLGAGAAPLDVTVPRVEALEVHAVVDDREAVARDRLSVVYNGVDLESFHPRNRHVERRGARAEIGVAADAWTLLFVGSGFERKGLATAIDAFAALADRSSRLVVVGKGSTQPFRDRATRLGVDRRIAWLGPRPDIERWYAAADVVVLPSRYEPFGNVHLEALASGVPVVASAAAGGAEVIVDGGGGAVVDPRDAGAVATALGRLREKNPAELAAAARRAAEPFTFTAQVAGFQRVYRRITAATSDFS